jgi:voltage-gated sodium channel
MHPDTKKAVSTPTRKTAINSEHTTNLLPSCPDIFCPAIQATLSNVSGLSAGSEPHIALRTYKKFRSDDGRVKSEVSFTSQDTFSTFGGDVNVWGDSSKRIPFKFVDWQVSWPEDVVKSRTFKRVSISLILLHCIICAVATADFVTEDASVQSYFDLTKDMFVYIMSAELFVQFIHNGLGLFTNGWLVFDFIWICAAWAMPNILVMRTFRVVRTLRLASWIKDLKQLVLALLLVIPKMFAIFFLLTILFLIFSILFTDLFKHTYADQITDKDYFGRLDTTLFTLFQIMTLDGWAEICTQIMEVHKWACVPFIGFVVVSSFFFLNLVIAVVCEAVTSVHRDTVVKYIQDDISAATSVRDALKTEDRLDKLADSVQLMMQAQITMLETLQMQQVQPNRQAEVDPIELTEKEFRLQKQKQSLQQELDGTAAATSQSSSKDASRDMTPPPPEDLLREKYSLAMNMTWEEQQRRPHPPAFDSQTGPSSPVFWRQAGLTENQISKVMVALNQKSISRVQQPPEGAHH